MLIDRARSQLLLVDRQQRVMPAIPGAAAVLADCVGSRRAEDRDRALSRMRDEGVRIVTRKMVIFEWLGEAATPLFRDVSKALLK